MSNFEKVKKSVPGIIKRALKPCRVSKVNIREDESGYDGEPLYRIDIVFEGGRPKPDNVSKMFIRVQDYLWDINDERSPLYSFVADTGRRKAS